MNELLPVSKFRQGKNCFFLNDRKIEIPPYPTGQTGPVNGGEQTNSNLLVSIENYHFSIGTF